MSFTVYKLDENGRIIWQYPATVTQRSATHVRLEAIFQRDDMDLGYTIFKQGDRFVEYFYSDRWYNVFAVYDRDDGQLKGWYCNICRPSVIAATAVRCEDLALDLWVTPQGDVTLLDEDEFAALALTAVEQNQAAQAVAQLQAQAANNTLPR